MITEFIPFLEGGGLLSSKVKDAMKKNEYLLLHKEIKHPIIINEASL